MVEGRSAESARHRAQSALLEIEAAIRDILRDAPGGLRNIDIAVALGLKSGTVDGHRNYLTWSVLTGLVSRGDVEKSADKNPLYRLTGR